MTQESRISENIVAEAVVRILTDFGGKASVSRIKRAIPRYIDLNDNDRAPSTTRPGEELWEQQVRNIVCHRHCEHNFVHDGVLKYHAGNLSLAANDGSSSQMDLFSN